MSDLSDYSDEEIVAEYDFRMRLQAQPQMTRQKADEILEAIGMEQQLEEIRGLPEA